MIKHLATRIALPLALVFLAAGWIALPPAKTLTFTQESRIWVTGTSTVHDWTCEASSFDGGVQLPAEGDALRNLTVTKVQVPVKALDCKNGTMHKKVADALKAKSNPNINFVFSGVSVGSAAADGGQNLKVSGTLEIAGARKDVTIDAVGYAKGDGTYRFTGALPVQMSSFDVAPPTAMLGALKTGDQVVVNFDVIAR